MLLGSHTEHELSDEVIARHADRIFDEFDLDHDGVITMDDFLEICKNVRSIFRVDWNYRLIIDNRWCYSQLFFYRILICLYFFPIDFQPWTYLVLRKNTFDKKHELVIFGWRHCSIFHLNLFTCANLMSYFIIECESKEFHSVDRWQRQLYLNIVKFCPLSPNKNRELFWRWRGSIKRYPKPDGPS